MAALLMLIAALVIQPIQTEDAMAYTTVAEVKTAYADSHLAELTGDAAGETIDDARLQKAVDDYGDYVEAYVRMQHPDNPFDTTNKVLNQINVEGAYLLLRKASAAGLDDEMRHAETRLDRLLARIGDGKLRLMDADDVAAATEAIEPTDMFKGKKRLFGRYRQDIDLTS